MYFIYKTPRQFRKIAATGHTQNQPRSDDDSQK